MTRRSLLDRGRRLALAAAVALGAGACAAPQGPSPAQILVRNASAADVDYVWLQEVAAEDAPSVRMGMVSPLPRGATQVVGRSASARPLPAEVELAWKPTSGDRRTQRISLAELADAPGATQGAVVFELLPSGTFQVYIAPREER